jgi:hypothetical protein
MEGLEFEAIVLKLAFGSFDSAQNVRFPLANGARTGFPKGFQCEKGFLSVVPGNGKFLANDVDTVWHDAGGCCHW